MCSKGMTWAGELPVDFTGKLRQFQAIRHVYRSDVTDSMKFYCAELPSRVLLDAAVQQVMTEHSYAQLPLSKR